MELSKQKTTTAFLDNDRGGELNLKSLLETSEIDYVAIAPDGKEVEELSKKEVFKALRDKVAASQFKIENNITNGNKKTTYTKKEKYVSTSKYKQTKKEVPEKKFVSRVSSAVDISEDQKKIFKKTLDELIGTRAACIFDSTFNILGKVPVKELENTLSKLEDDPYAVIFDGKVDYKLDLVAKKKGIKFLVGMDKEDVKSSVKILSKKDLI